MKINKELITFENNLLRAHKWAHRFFIFSFINYFPASLITYEKILNENSKMKTLPHFTKKLKPLYLFLLLTSGFVACENHRFDSDKRQIMAKDEIRSKLHKVSGYDITGFKEDTIEVTGLPDLKKEIRYQLDFEYLDSGKVLQKKTGEVFFTPDGASIINSKITDR